MILICEISKINSPRVYLNFFFFSDLTEIMNHNIIMEIILRRGHVRSSSETIRIEYPLKYDINCYELK